MLLVIAQPVVARLTSAHAAADLLNTRISFLKILRGAFVLNASFCMITGGGAFAQSERCFCATHPRGALPSLRDVFLPKSESDLAPPLEICLPFVWKTANNRAVFRAVCAEYKKHKARGIFASQKKTSDNCSLPREVGAKSKRGFYAEKGVAMYSNLILDYGKGGRQGY